MNNCCSLYFLSTLACTLAESLSEEELTALSSDLVVLGDMLAKLIVSQTSCKNNG